jgi:erythromycin esterase-like protein
MVGVIYRPEAEIWNHYMNVQPGDQFDLLVHLDDTTALAPLEPAAPPVGSPATHPSGW